MTGPAKKIIAGLLNTIRSRWHGSVNYRIAYSLILVTVLVALVFGIITVTTLFHFARSKEAASLNNRIELSSSRMESLLNDIAYDVGVLARSTIFMNALVDTYGRDSYLIPFLKGLRLMETVPHRLSLCDFQGTVIASSTGTSGWYNDKNLLDEVIAKNRPVAKIVNRGEKAGKNLLLFYPVIYSATGTSEGFLVFEASLQDIMKILPTENGISYLLYQKDETAAGATAKENRETLRQKLHLEDPLRALDLSLEVRTRSGHTVLWVNGMLTLATVLMIWLAIRISHRVSNHLTHRIVLLSDAARRIAESGTPDSNVSVSGNDEIKQLAEAFNRMVDRLRVSYDELERRVKERTLLLAETNKNLTGEIEQRYDAEQRLSESERKYRELVENANSVILTFDLNGTVTFFNTYAEQFFGFAQEEIIGKNVVGTIVPELDSSGRNLATMVREICSGPERFEDNENENITKDGRRVWVQWMNKAVLDGAGTPAAILSIGHDITERKHAEEKLRKSEDRLSKAQEIAHIGNWEWNLVTNELYWSLEVYHIFGVDPAVYIPRFDSVGKTMHPDDFGNNRKAIQAAINERKPFENYYRLIRPDGTIRWVHTLGEITWDPAGKPRMMVGTIQDITGQKQAEEALRKSEERLSKAQAMAHVGNWEWNLVTNELYWSEEVYHIYGVDPAHFEPTFQTVGKAMHPDDLAPFLQAVHAAIYDHQPYGIHYRLIRPDGEVRTVHAIGKVTYDPSGKPLVKAGTVQDVTEQKKAEEALRQSMVRATEEKLKSEAIISALADEMVILDPDFRIIYQNKSVLEKMGNHIGGKCYQVFENKKSLCEDCPVALTFGDGQVHRGERTAPSVIGALYLDITASPLRDASGNVIAVVEMVRDITARKKDEESLLLFRNLLDRSNDAIFVNDPATGRYLTVNQKACSSLGYDRSRLLGLTVMDTEARFSDQSAWDDHVRELKGSGHLILEGQNRRRDGTLFPVETNVAYLTSGGQDYMVAVVRDITERKKAEASLRESEQRFRGAFENAAVGASMVDLKGRFIKVNRFLCEMLGYTEAEMLSKTFSDVTHPDDVHIGLEYLKRQVSGELDFASFEKRYIRKDGSIVYIIVSPAIIRDGLGAPQYFVGLFQNITERRKLLDQLEHLNRNLAERVWEEIAKNRTKEQLLQLQSRHAAMGEMIDNIAHQWRQPLNNLGLVMQGMQKKFSDGSLTRERMQEQTKTGMSLIRYMSQTISDFTNFFRHDKELSTFKAKDVVATALSFIETSLKKNGISVVVDIADDIMIKGYRNEYTQVLVNILNNARDVFVERAVQKPAIRLCAFRENSSSILAIADNGGGISEELFDRIFTPYFTTKEHNKGTGIGLYMSKTIIENNMNGKLTVRNNQNGAEFRIEVRGA